MATALGGYLTSHARFEALGHRSSPGAAFWNQRYRCKRLRYNMKLVTRTGVALDHALHNSHLPMLFIWNFCGADATQPRLVGCTPGAALGPSKALARWRWWR